MKPLCYFAFTLLCTLSCLPHVFSIQCNLRQYVWPVDTPKLCCDMCQPGHRMVRRQQKTCGIDCEPCMENRYADTYNVQLYCNVCDRCNEPNMEYESKCNSTHNTVCRCKAGYMCKDQPCKDCVLIPATTMSTLPPSTSAGYRCKDQPCKQMVPIPATTTSTPAPSTTAPKPAILTTPTPFKPFGDTVWFLVIIVLLSAGLASVVVANIKPFLHWIRSEHGYFLAGKPAPAPICSEDEEVSTPVQEVCGKCDQPIDV